METNKVKAMKNGAIKLFSQHSWDIANPEREGWEKLGVVRESVTVGVEQIPLMDGNEIVPIVVSEVGEVEAGDNLTATQTDEELDGALYPTDEEIRAYFQGLFDNGEIPKMPHHALGTKKLRKFYDENSK